MADEGASKREKREVDTQLPAGWIQKESKSKPGKYYYFNTATQESVWERPTAAASSKGSTAQSSGPSKVRASHILAKHRDSRRPSSWRQNTITRTKAEAIEIIKRHREAIAQGADFAKIAETESDCSSAKRGGDLGAFGRGQMQTTDVMTPGSHTTCLASPCFPANAEAFEKAAFALKVGELSDLVDTDSGIHIILRTE
ncbi:uncharacterized protein MONBRDRAFT_33031 [Monosiga brevicollis MX1]|uniref:Peptidyl-prolyl cis-trans isomerase n=1 Tax=Monosiga brevicollis TaxID=81824 RepID=A9V341_MONBE|nr:uncharacterized protein MONBRDRAFT_33031 [Monosiga brevicollis MX1]EDQ88122.1 predicted protein [Monosiga brevicollis MX1]|eukprot:XP_001747198.1 hypothetical protein [Monosiga brevicollis MX1]